MLADTEAGSVVTVAQSGAQWGYRLLLPNLLLIPVMFAAQEVAMRLGLATRQGAVALVQQRYGRGAAGVLLGALAASCFGALVSEMSGLAGAAQSFGVPVELTMVATVGGLIAVVVSGSYRSVERIALSLGALELAFLVMAWRASPGFAPIARQAVQLPLRDSSFLYLLAANLGTGVIPWALLYQQSASVDKGLTPSNAWSARWETLTGVVVCQTVTVALLIAAAATLGHGMPLDTIPEIEIAFTATLGVVIGRVVFVLGLSGGALVATIVVCLTLAWTVGELLDVRHALERHPKQVPAFYASLSLMLAAGGALVASGINLVSLAIGAGVLNALLLPLVLGFLYCLARSPSMGALRLRGAYGVLVLLVFFATGLTCLCAGLAGFF